MYNRYVRNDTGQYERIPVQDSPPPGPEAGFSPDFSPGGNPPPPPPDPDYSGAPPPGGERKGFLSGLLDRLNLKNMDTGDLILLLLIFLLFRDSEDDELLIALGLLLIL